MIYGHCIGGRAEVEGVGAGIQSERNKYRKGARSFAVFVPHAACSTPAHKLLGLDQIISIQRSDTSIKEMAVQDSAVSSFLGVRHL